MEGNVVYVRENAKFDIEPNLELKQAAQREPARATDCFSPETFCASVDTECQIADDRYDRLKLLLNKGTLSLELLKNDWEDTSDFFETIKLGFELIRVITPNAEVLITQPGIFRINISDGRTELVVRRGSGDRRPGEGETRRDFNARVGQRY